MPRTRFRIPPCLLIVVAAALAMGISRLTATFGFPLARVITAVLGLFILILGVFGVEMYLFSRNLWFGRKGTRSDGTADRLGRPKSRPKRGAQESVG
jgi:uncharacterized membrane protein